MSQHTLLGPGGSETVTTVPGGGVGVIIEDITMPSLPSFDEELCPAEGGGLGHPAPQEGSPVLAVENIRLGHHRASLELVRAQFKA